MATASIRGVRITGIASAVPNTSTAIRDAVDQFGEEDVSKIIQRTGVEQRHVAAPKLCCSDLCYAAAKRLLADLNWDPSSVEGLIFVSQSPDFPCVPATSCVLQARLGMAKSTAVFDLALGCSGHIYGLWVGASLLAASGLSRLLVLAGDVSTRGVSPLDRSTALLFGDAGSVTALEKDPEAPALSFSLGTDGTGWKHLVMPTGIQSSRHPRNETTAVRRKAEANNWRSQDELFMDGTEVFAFTIREVPPLISDVLAVSNWTLDEVDYFVFHQANKFMLTHLARSMKLPLPKIPFSLKEYGNTSSASVPITINSQLAEPIRTRPLKLLMAGFGVGYSWGACAASCGPIVAPPVVHVDESEAWQC
jgi:3-oxoacyl-[acyl-carrier-protein] synthase III